MPYRFSWLVKDKALVIRIWGPVMLEDHQVIAPEIERHLSASPIPLYVLVDLRDVSNSYIKITALVQTYRNLSFKKVEKVYLVAPNRAATMVINTLTALLSRTRWHVMGSMKEVQTALHHDFPELPLEALAQLE